MVLLHIQTFLSMEYIDVDDDFDVVDYLMIDYDQQDIEEEYDDHYLYIYCIKQLHYRIK